MYKEIETLKELYDVGKTVFKNARSLYPDEEAILDRYFTKKSKKIDKKGEDK